MSKKQKLELTWIGKENRPKLEPRILLEEPGKSYHATHRVSENDIFDNRLIFGDNLLALKALEAEFAGKVKCIYIDPPFNTQQAFEHYDDGVEHSIWLSLIRDRLEILRRLLSADGTLFVHIDDNELGYLIVLLDEIFGRPNRISITTFKQSAASGPKAINPGLVTTNNYVLYYAKDKATWSPNRVYVPTSRDDRYSKIIDNFDDDFSKWRLIGLREAFLRLNKLEVWDEVKKKFADRLEEKLSGFVVANAPRVVRTARVAPKDVNEEAREALSASNADRSRVFRSVREGKEDYYFLGGEQLIFYKAKTKVIDGVVCTASPLTNLWDDLLSNNLHNEGGVAFPNGKKPESLIKRCLELSTNPLPAGSPHPHHPAPEEGHRRRRPRRHHRGRELERRRRLPLLPARAFAAGKGQVGQLGHQQATTTPPCWPRPCASWRASPTRPAIRCTGSTAIPPSAST
jgi:adenine-specific DNA-methyltransferase